MPALDSLFEALKFDFSFQPSIDARWCANSAPLASSGGRRTSCCWVRQALAKRILPSGLPSRLPKRATGCCF